MISKKKKKNKEPQSSVILLGNTHARTHAHREAYASLHAQTLC